jgi:hypothetical protein
MTTYPKFTHDCEACTYLGHKDDHDLYVCQSEETKRFTYIARYGNDGDAYTSLPATILKSIPRDSSYILFKALRCHQVALQNEIALRYGPEERTEPHITF